MVRVFFIVTTSRFSEREGKGGHFYDGNKVSC